MKCTLRALPTSFKEPFWRTSRPLVSQVGSRKSGSTSSVQSSSQCFSSFGSSPSFQKSFSASLSFGKSLSTSFREEKCTLRAELKSSLFCLGCPSLLQFPRSLAKVSLNSANLCLFAPIYFYTNRPHLRSRWFVVFEVAHFIPLIRCI